MSRSHLLSLSAALLIASAASAQTTSPFSVKVQQGTTIVNAADGSSIAFAAEAIGRPTEATATFTHPGVLPANSTVPVGVATITAVEVSGSTDFTVTGPDAGQTFTPNTTFVLAVRYRPSTSNRVTGVAKVSYSFQLPTPSTGVAPRPTTGSISLNLSGVAPEFTFSYQPPPSGNTTPLNPNDTITFPITNVNETPSATVIITNKGTGPGVVNAITVAGAAFTAGSLPLVNTSVEGGRELRFTVRYSPLQIETNRGTVRIDLVDRSVTFNLLGSSMGPVFTYSVFKDSGAAALLAGDSRSTSTRRRRAGLPGGCASARIHSRSPGTAWVRHWFIRSSPAV